MPPVDFTPQQKSALDAKGVDVALSAGAGCGKTFVLAHRFLGEIRPPGGRDLSRVAALTFTNKAARELRERVRSYCRAEARYAREEADREPWTRLARELEAAPISTFHVFCKGILKRFPVQAGLDPGFGLLEGPLGERRRADAVDATLRRALREGDVDLRPLAVTYGLGFVQNSLASLLLSQDFQDLAEQAAPDETTLLRAWNEVFVGRVQAEGRTRLLRSADAALEEITAHDLSFSEKMRDRARSLTFEIPKLSAAVENEIPSILVEIRKQATIQHVQKWPDVSARERIKAVFESLREEIDRFGPLLALDPNHSREAAIVVVRLRRLATRLARTYRERKDGDGLVDYNDLLIKTRDLLRRESDDVRRMLSDELDAILIDEFQDTDPIQEEIVRRIAGPDRLGGRLYVVGDVKQSIYGFRGARPDLFARMQEEIPPEGRLPLSENFRSLPGILDFVNLLFADAFDGPYEPLVSRVGRDDRPAPVAFLWGPISPDSKRDARRDRREEGIRIAEYLRTLLASGRVVRDKETKRERPVRAGDVAILFRSLTDLAPYERALSDVGLEHHVIGGRAFYAQQEVTDICNVLSVVEDPHDAVSLAGALRGPFFGLSDAGLYALFLAGGRDLAAGLRLIRDGGAASLTARDREAAMRTCRRRDEWRSLKDRLPVARLVDRVLSDSGFEPSLLGEPLGDRKRSNARKIVALAARYDAEGGLTIADFVERMREDLRTPPRESEAATTDESGDVVRLLSIHQSKGLEFPIVVLPDLDRKEAGSKDTLAVDPEIGLVVNLGASSDETEESSEGAANLRNIGWLTHRHLQKQRDRAEALRVFYVATTRARDLLVLSSAASPEAEPVSPAMELLASRFERATGRRCVPLPQGWSEPEVEVVPNPVPTDGAKVARRRPDLLRMIETIRTSPSPPQTPRASSVSDRVVPRAVARLDALLRGSIRDPKLYEPQQWRRVVRRAASVARPAIGDGLIQELSRRLSRWIEGSFGSAVAKSADVIAGRCVRIPAEVRFDLAYRDEAGAWNLVDLSLVESDASEAADRVLRAAATTAACGLPAMDRLWLLRLGDGGGLESVR